MAASCKIYFQMGGQQRKAQENVHAFVLDMQMSENGFEQWYKKKMQCHCCDRGIRSSGQETSLRDDRLIHCLPVCVGDKAAPVPSQGLRWVQSWLRVM